MGHEGHNQRREDAKIQITKVEFQMLKWWRTYLQIRQRLKYKKGDETNISFWSHSFWLGLHGWRRKGRRREEEEEEEEGEEQRYVFLYGIKCILDS